MTKLRVYQVTKYTTCSYTAMVLADDEDHAFNILHSLDLDDCFQEETACHTHDVKHDKIEDQGALPLYAQFHDGYRMVSIHHNHKPLKEKD